MKGDRLYSKALEKAKNEDNSTAFELLKRASKLNNPNANYAIGTWYLHGKFVKKNLVEATKFLLNAAKEKHPEALFDLGVCYENGIGVTKNLRSAFECYLQASLRGEKQSVYEVGRCYYYGIGIDENKIIADYWLERAEELGIEE